MKYYGSDRKRTLLLLIQFRIKEVILDYWKGLILGFICNYFLIFYDSIKLPVRINTLVEFVDNKTSLKHQGLLYNEKTSE